MYASGIKSFLTLNRLTHVRGYCMLNEGIMRRFSFLSFLVSILILNPPKNPLYEDLSKRMKQHPVASGG
ncbi:hypothetical protein EBA29_03613 [Bacillus velezensis]|nr:hypothetical protein EBA29_03613 [Bacillus velezensis]